MFPENLQTISTAIGPQKKCTHPKRPPYLVKVGGCDLARLVSLGEDWLCPRKSSGSGSVGGDELSNTAGKVDSPLPFPGDKEVTEKEVEAATFVEVGIKISGELEFERNGEGGSPKHSGDTPIDP